MSLLATAPVFAQTTVLWKEGFEDADFWARWHADGGIWSVGTPNSGPGQACAGRACAATLLDSDYPPWTDSRLVRDRVFILPPAAQHPRLRFWHWFRGGSGVARSVEIRVGAGSWETLKVTSGWKGDGWTRAWCDLSDYGGQAAYLAFHFQADGSTNVAAGWFLDEVEVESGPVGSDLINDPDGFESGFGQWSVDGGIWQVITPGQEVPGSLEGTNCVGTVFDRTDLGGASSRLISRDFLVPPDADQPRLRFWHWFKTSPTDRIQVEISVDGAPWQPLSMPFGQTSAAWTRPSLDLRPFAERSARIAFHFQSGSGSGAAGQWCVDGVLVETGPADADWAVRGEGFEAGLGDWSAENGAWEVGNPSSGPKTSSGGMKCAAIGLSAPYPSHADSRLVSPEFVVPNLDGKAMLAFTQWYDIADGDEASVEVLLNGRWRTLAQPFAGSVQAWTRKFYDLSAYIGERVQIGFRFRSNGDEAAGLGWFLDDIGVFGVTPVLSVRRLSPEAVTLWVKGPAGAVYILEKTLGIQVAPGTTEWLSVDPIWNGTQTNLMSSGTAEYYRVRLLH